MENKMQTEFSVDKLLEFLEVVPELVQAELEREGELTFARDTAEQSAWNHIKLELENIKLTSNNRISGDLKSEALAITAGLQTPTTSGKSAFSELHIEPLIDQAADLLDRCLRDRKEWDDNQGKWLELLFELFEYAELDEIHKEEVQAGVYDYPSDVSKAEALAQKVHAQFQDALQKFIKSYGDNFLSTADMNEVVNASAKSAWLSGCVPWSWKGQSFAGYTNHSFNGVAKQVSEHGLDAGVTLSVNSIVHQQRMVEAQRGGYEGQYTVATILKDGLISKAAWDYANRQFQRRRTIVARRYQDIKTLSATHPSGALNYGKRLPSIQKRFRNDFHDAFLRMLSIERGLRSVYGFDHKLPTDFTSPEYFDQCLLWTRTAIQWLISFSRNDQSVVIPISVLELVGEANWENNVKNRQWDFQIPSSLFDGMSHVRLRGISATSEDRGKDRLWDISVSVPRKAIAFHLDGTTSELDQSSVPSVRLARVTAFNSPRSPDVVGVSALHNASPIHSDSAHWNMSLNGSVPNTDHTDLQNIVLNLHFSFRSA
ncbi:hypothetical protein ACOKV8_000547 [Vibrio parahaemolyticus]